MKNTSKVLDLAIAKLGQWKKSSKMHDFMHYTVIFQEFYMKHGKRHMPIDYNWFVIIEMNIEYMCCRLSEFIDLFYEVDAPINSWNIFQSIEINIIYLNKSKMSLSWWMVLYSQKHLQSGLVRCLLYISSNLFHRVSVHLLLTRVKTSMNYSEKLIEVNSFKWLSHYAN